ncbi:GspH/FimT family pseudopilin [Crenobacter cavernae]|nr:GspH/FimT family pseudopilin [Crenobacter cavernae]
MTSPLLRHQRGFTLLELMITLSVLAILVAVAAPAFNQTMASSRAAGLSNALVGSLNLARSEAIKRGQTVTVCKTANPNAANTNCAAGAAWRDGWLVFVDNGTRGTVDGNDVRIKVVQPSGIGETNVSAGGNVANYLSFLPRGESRGSDGAVPSASLNICTGGIQRRVLVNAVGRTHIAKGDC